MKYASLNFSNLPRIMYAHSCTINELRGQLRVNTYYELTVVEKGEMVIKSDVLGYHTIGAGQFFFAPAGMGYETIINKSMKHSCVAFFLEGGCKIVAEDKVIFEKRNNTLVVKLENVYLPIAGRVHDLNIMALMQRIICEQIRPSQEYSNLICSQLIIELLISVSTKIHHEKELPGELYYCEKVIAYITENFSDAELNMNTIAENVGLHPNYLSSIFRKITGNTIMSSVKQIRLDESKRLLNLNKYFIKDISKMVGFEDSNYFSVVFKNYAGVSPEQFVKNSNAIKAAKN